jgi:molecular chaperone GrpE
VQLEVASALRELEAAKARVERGARAVEDDPRRRLISELLPVLDNLDRTIRASIDDGSAPALVDGVRLVREQLEGVLRGYGVKRISALAQRFDPSWQEAIALGPVDDPELDGIVIEESQPCYRYEGSLLRPAKVVVGRSQFRE